MLTLAIETATAACSVALLRDGILLAERHEEVGRGHAERLVPAVAELLAEAGGTPQRILVDCGPGSFTGVRVGLAAARAFALGWGAEIGGFSSLALIAATVRDVESVSVAIPGGHGELFVQRFATAPLQALTPVRSLVPEAAAAELVDLLVIGTAADAVVRLRGTGEARTALPRAADVALLPAAMAALPPTPLYGREPDAKVPA